MYLVAGVWSVPDFRPYCKPGLHSDHVTVNVSHVAVKMHPSQHMLVIIRSWAVHGEEVEEPYVSAVHRQEEEEEEEEDLEMCVS